MSEESLQATDDKLIHIGKPIEMNDKELLDTLEKMRKAMYDEKEDIRGIVQTIVPTYNPNAAPRSKYDSAVFVNSNQ